MPKAVTTLTSALVRIKGDSTITWERLSEGTGYEAHRLRSVLVNREGLASDSDGSIRLTEKGRRRVAAEDALVDYMILHAGTTVSSAGASYAMRHTAGWSLNPHSIARAFASAGAVKSSTKLWRLPDSIPVEGQRCPTRLRGTGTCTTASATGTSTPRARPTASPATRR